MALSLIYLVITAHTLKSVQLLIVQNPFSEYVEEISNNLFTVILQKRLKKEKKARKRLLDQLDSEQKRAAHLDESPKSSPTDPLRLSNGELVKYHCVFCTALMNSQ